MPPPIPTPEAIPVIQADETPPPWKAPPRAWMWTACAGWATLVILFHLAEYGKAGTNAAVQAASAGHACALIVAGYVICRAIDFSFFKKGE